MDGEPRLSNREEDALLKVGTINFGGLIFHCAAFQDTTGSFADWVTSFIRRVIQLLENLPEEGPNGGGGGGATEGTDS